jgi:uncharacterized membrane-anchored protein YhcB (DUF1043 family)
MIEAAAAIVAGMVVCYVAIRLTEWWPRHKRVKALREHEHDDNPEEGG